MLSLSVQPLQDMSYEETLGKTMRLMGAAIAFAVLSVGVLVATNAEAGLILSADGMTVYDSANNVTWLANADLAAIMPLGVAPCGGAVTSGCVNKSGAMDYAAAVQWVGDLNSTAYQGHTNWQLPTTASLDKGCTATGPHGEHFGYGCSASALGSLYINSLALTAPAAVTPPVTGAIGPFTNLQPNLYWSNTAQNASPDGYHTFSFATGWRGSNQGVNSLNPLLGVTANFLDVLPVIPVASDPHIAGTVYDAAAGVVFLADGNLASQNTFGLPICGGIGATGNPGPPPCVNGNGTMDRKSAKAFIDAMNAFVNPDKSIGYLGRQDWELPVSTESNACSYAACDADPTADPMADLFYNVLGLKQGQSVADPYSGSNGVFNSFQSYLYWSCQAADPSNPVAQSSCSPVPQCTPQTQPSPCAADMEWSFNFGDGFQGTDEEVNSLFVTAYYVDSVPEPSTLVIFGACLFGLVGFGMIRRRANT